jgi:molybdate transport system substrate-binding protein
MSRLSLCYLCCALLLGLPVNIGQGATVIVFAAASLADALKEIAARYERQTPDQVKLNLGASSLLARQIQEGAPTDIFFSADEAKMDSLEKRDLIVVGTRRRLLSNSLVIVIPGEDEVQLQTPQDLASSKIRHLALAETRTVPAGIYAREYLQKQKLWPAVEGKVVPTENVRAALAAVESGDAEAAIVYKTDAAISKRVKIAYEIPESASPNISYPAALLKEAPSPQAGKRFLEFLVSTDARKIFEKFGFVVRK